MGAGASVLCGSLLGVETRGGPWGYVAWAPGMSDESGDDESSDAFDQEPVLVIPVIPEAFWRPALGGA